MEILLTIAMTLAWALALLIMRKQPRGEPDAWLSATFVVLGTCFMFWIALRQAPLITQTPVFSILWPAFLCLGPCQWLYVRRLSGTGGRIWPHFLPYFCAVAVHVWSSDVWIADDNGILRVSNTHIGIVWLAYLLPISVLIYPLACIAALATRKSERSNHFSEASSVHLEWVRMWMWTTSLICLIALLLFHPSLQVLLPATVTTPLLVALMTVQMAFVAWHGFRQPSLPLAPTPSAAQKPPITDADIDRLTRVVAVDALYLNPTLTIDELAKRLSWSVSKTSRCLNQRLDMTFFDYINQHRVAHLKSSMQEPKNAPITVLSLALDSGFNSKSAFYEAFRKHAGMTPSQFRRSIRSGNTPAVK